MEEESETILTPREKQIRKYARRLAFTKYVESKKLSPDGRELQWICCNEQFNNLKDIHCHISLNHKPEVDVQFQDILKHGSPEARWAALHRAEDSSELEGNVYNHRDSQGLPTKLTEADEFPWFPKFEETSQGQKGRILLYYKYREIENTAHVRNWQEILCKRLGLTGKVRIAAEGINTTLGGTMSATQVYMQAMMKHPLFCDMTPEDFKTSAGGAEEFDCLKVGVYAEIVPMGVDPKACSYRDTGEHLTPEEWHAAVDKFYLNQDNMQDKALLIDCRNFYESRIGKFRGALAPDIRKFSYWPEYIEKNLNMFRDKEVYMYCTGGIRCEKGSAYLVNKGICKGIYHLKGGIHKYMEQFPEGHYRGKLFVFDNRYTIQSNNDVISNCRYCDKPWDAYKPCNGQHCHQLVLSCEDCTSKGLTACCPTCQQHTEANITKEECECTQNRSRIPIEASH